MLPRDITPEQIAATFVKRGHRTEITLLVKNSTIFHLLFSGRLPIRIRTGNKRNRCKKIKNTVVSHRTDEALDLFQVGGEAHTPNGKENNNTISETSVAEGRFFIVRLNRLGVSASHVSGNLCAQRLRWPAIADVVAPPLSLSTPLAQRFHYRTSGCLVYDNGSQYIWRQDQHLSSEFIR